MKNSIKYSSTTEFLTPHGVFLAIFDKGVLLQGPSGSGKSECALTLLDRKHQLICDDAPLFIKKENHLIGSSPANLQNLLEVRGLGIIDVKKLFGINAIQQSMRLELIIEFVKSDTPFERTIDLKLTNKNMLDIPIPLLKLPVIFSRNMAILIETAVRLVFTNSSTSLKQLLHLEKTE
ncbi:MAG: hypothetical protein JSS07_08930 [Proteobacteria bacterium]|nr:hypothetical protein [Pseudomonadota bacterium]